MPPVHIDYEMVETEMAEDIEVSLRRTHDMGVSKNREDLERHSDVIWGVYLFQGFGLSQLDGRRRLHVSQ